MESKRLGELAEKLACHYLKKKKLKLLARNYRCRWGEIDLVMKDKEILVFVEVRYRKTLDFGHSIETIHRLKQKKIIKAAEHYVNTHRLSNLNCRFDVIGITAYPSSFNDLDVFKSLPIRWIQNAFIK